MKKIFYLILTVGLSLEAYSVESRLSGGMFDFESSDINTSAKELPMSPYKDGKIAFFRNDTAYVFQPNSEGMIDKIEICPELMGLGIDGTFAYDEKNNKLYFSKLGEAEKNDLFEASWSKEEKKWDKVTMLQIKGIMPQPLKYKNSSLAVSRWVQQGRGASGLYNPSLGKGGKRIYFSGEFKAGKGSRDLWYIDQEANGIWSRPVLLGDSVVNGASSEDYPLIVGDTLLFFTSDRTGGNGGQDIYMSHGEDNKWGEAEALSDLVNTPSNDYNIIFGKNIGVFFISDRPGGKGSDDIYAPAPFYVTHDTELALELPLDEPKGFHWVLFFFDLDKYVMKPEYEVQLDELVEAMKEFPGATFEISGHTDSRGDDNYNMRLSDKRAKFVRELLLKRGVDPTILVAVGKGETEPIVPNAQTEPEHEQNRRVDVKIINE